MIMPRIPFSCPETGAVLTAGPKGLLRADGRLYPWLQGCAEVPDFLSPADAGEGQRASLAMYDTAAATAMYRNFLDWLFATCQQDEAAFRRDLASRPARSALRPVVPLCQPQQGLRRPRRGLPKRGPQQSKRA